MQIAIAENSRVALDQDEYEKRYAELTARYEKSKAKYDDIAEQIESKKVLFSTLNDASFFTLNGAISA